MFTISREFNFSYGHRLLGYEGRCCHLHGHNARVRVSLSEQSLNEKGMILDFTFLKETLGSWIDQELDHKMILQREDPLVAILKKAGEPVYETTGNPTAEFLARLIFERASELGLKVESVVFWETEKCRAIYRETSEGPNV